MKSLCIYADKGTGRRSIKHLIKALKSSSLPPGTSIKTINSHTLLSTNWESETALLIFPGGRDIPYHETLKGKGNAKIQRFVEMGGKFLGICAGAYYGSSAFEFEKGSPLEVLAERELAFYPGIAKGPAYGTHQFCYESERGAKIVPIDWLGVVQYACYYNGGCYFPEADSLTNVCILGRYADLPHTPAAIVECSVGNGIALLSGVHPEEPIPEWQGNQLFTLILKQLRLSL